MHEIPIQTKAPRFRRGRIPAAVGMAIAAAMIFVGCAKQPTEILTEIKTDSTVPALLVLQYTITSASGPARTFTSSVVSLAPGDAAAPAPFFFPMTMRMGPLAGWSGAVEITLNGRDWDTDKIIATGTTTAEAVPETSTRATLTLTAFSDPGGGDGGTDGGADGGTDGGTDAGTGADADDDATSNDAPSDS